VTWYRTDKGVGVALINIKVDRVSVQCCRLGDACPGASICAYERGGRIYQGYICHHLLESSKVDREAIPSHLRPALLAELDNHLQELASVESIACMLRRLT
jgi:hypothetical protein